MEHIHGKRRGEYENSECWWENLGKAAMGENLK
jgi:hypothetical protein